MCDGVTKDVTVGTSIADVIQRANIDLNKSKTNIPCDLLKNDEFSNIKNGDLALYWLKTPIKGILLRKIASEEQLRGSKLIRAVGFGLTSNDKWGTKFAIDIPISSYDCTEPKFDTGKYRCSANSELSAAGLNRDTCEGDSGGPTYVLGKDVSLYLAAVTSRSIKPDSSCGKGGIYVKLTTKTVRDWLVKNGVPTSAFAQ
jgi:hypothetical protein